MNKLKYISSLFVLLLVAAIPAQAQNMVLTSVGKAGDTYIEPVPGQNAVNFPTTGGSQSVTVKTNTTLSVAASESWCKATVDNGTVTVSADENTGADIREANINVNALDGKQATIKVRQLGTSPAFFVSESEVKVNGQNCSVILNITTNSELSFTLPDWISAVDDADATESKAYSFITESLPSKGERTGNITVALKNDASTAVEIPVTQTFEGYPHFIVMSDLHFGDGNATERVTRSLQNLLSQDSEIDAIIVNGDLTNSGAPEQYEQFKSVLEDENIVPSYIERHYIMGNHEWYASGDPLANYLTLGHDHNKYFEIKGYPFIYVGMSGGGEQDYSEEAYEFLRTSLKDASEKYAGKPIFVFTHIPVYGTTHGSTATDGEWGNKTFKSIFDAYPQIIHFCGHTHFSLRDPKALWQGEFTSIDEGGNNYCYLTPGIDVDGSTPNGVNEVQEGVIVAVEDLTNVNIRRFDSRRDEEIEPSWNISAPYDGTNMEYASYTGGDAPYFENTEITTEEGATGERKITFPQAIDDDVVLYYHVSVKNSNGEVLGEGNRCSSFYLGSDMPETRTITIDGLPDGFDMYAEVIAYDPYGNASEPIVSEPFSMGNYTPDPSVTAPTPDILDWVINDNGVASDATGTFVIENGPVTPGLYVDEVYGRNAAIFHGNRSEYYKFSYADNDKVKETLQNDVTFEVLFRPNDLGGTRVAMGAMQAGGVGLEIDDGVLSFYSAAGGGWPAATAKTKLKGGNYYHAVGTYNSATNKTCLYINGSPAAEIELTSPIDPATTDWIAVGGDASVDVEKCDFAFNGNIIAARIYSRAVSRDEVYYMNKYFEDMAEANQGGGGEEEPPVEVAPVADLMDIEFGENGAAKDISPVATELQTGTTVPETYYNETYKRWVAKFQNTGDNQEFYAVPYPDNGDIYNAMAGDFSLEVLAVVNNPGGNMPAIVSSQQQGGFGIEPAEDIEVWGNFRGGYATVYTGIDVEPGRYYHIVAVVDAGNNEVRTYVDGKFAGKIQTAGNLDYPQGAIGRYFCIGGDSRMDTFAREYPLEGEVALVRMYSHALSLGEAKKLYNDIQKTATQE